ncbi:FCD domain-containing protein [Streptomyces sp. CB02261]|uniref:FCD domain-containing protein n=1 Tax=Streptomyces sp. CB02261 TaxID=1703940 RepID=UPI001F51A3FE|nr:FCD domain-containing protein [Streptomyces sp. CB02261]
MQGLPDRGDNYAVYDRFAALDQEFHDTLAAASGHTLLAAAVERLHTQMLCRVELWSWGGSPRSLGAVRCGAVGWGGVGRVRVPRPAGTGRAGAVAGVRRGAGHRPAGVSCRSFLLPSRCRRRPWSSARRPPRGTPCRS